MLALVSSVVLCCALCACDSGSGCEANGFSATPGTGEALCLASTLSFDTQGHHCLCLLFVWLKVEMPVIACIHVQ